MLTDPPVLLITGPEELLLQREADRVLGELRDAHGPLDVADLRAADIRECGLPDLRTGSLFGSPRVVLIRGAQELPAEAAATLRDLLERPPPDAAVCLLATSTGRVKQLAKQIADRGGRTDLSLPRPWDEGEWARLVADEFSRHGRQADRDAVAAVLDHAGTDVPAIVEKVAQAASAAPPGRVSGEHVDAVVVGHGNRGSFAIADAMCDRKPGEAVTLLRGALEAGDEPVMILGALAYRLRTLVAVAGELEPKSVGLRLSKGQAGRLKGVRRNFGPGELTRAYRELADADVALKSGDLPAGLVLERAVARIAAPEDAASGPR